MSEANDTQIGGDHYKSQEVQPWDFIEQYGLGFMEGNIVKYMTRWRAKNGEQDLKKVRHYIVKLEELHDGGREPKDCAGKQAIERYCRANQIEDWREIILISIFSSKWDTMSFTHALLVIDSLIAHPVYEAAPDGKAEKP